MSFGEADYGRFRAAELTVWAARKQSEIRARHSHDARDVMLCTDAASRRDSALD
jgi:hypothetical protein